MKKKLPKAIGQTENIEQEVGRTLFVARQQNVRRIQTNLLKFRREKNEAAESEQEHGGESSVKLFCAGEFVDVTGTQQSTKNVNYELWQRGNSETEKSQDRLLCIRSSWNIFTVHCK